MDTESDKAGKPGSRPDGDPPAAGRTTTAVETSERLDGPTRPPPAGRGDAVLEPL